MEALFDDRELMPDPVADGLVPIGQCSDGFFRVGQNGVLSVTSTGDGKVEFIGFNGHALAYVLSSTGYPAYYPIYPVEMTKPIKAVLMDLDGTTVRSETFWIWIIEMTTASLLHNPRFALEEADLPYVSGHSVTEHLNYCLEKYCPHGTLVEARRLYFEHTRREMAEIARGHGRQDAFEPAPGLKEFLLELKSMGMKIGLVTSGLYEKAWPEISSVFSRLHMGDPKFFYDAMITGGFPFGHGSVGTLGELSPKPHPWLYAEACCVGLGVPYAERNTVVGIEDSGAGICSIRLAGFPAIGLDGGNIVESGTRQLCTCYCNTLSEALAAIR